MKLFLLAVPALLGLASLAQAITVRKNVDVNGKKCDVVTWTDREGKERSIALVRSDGDTKGFSGGYVEEYSYFAGDRKVVAKAWNQAQAEVSGLGVAVNHHKGASSSKANSTGARTEFLVEGKSHVLWRFRSEMNGMGKSLGLVIDWMVSDGKSEILWSVSYDMSKLKDGEINWDARGPYFQFDWDGDGRFYDAPISGIRWGDKYRFKTTPYDRAKSGWDYSEPNKMPHMLLWKEGAEGDVECGVVQTQTWAEQDAGGYWWSPKVWGKTGTGMPENWNCPFQLNAYEGYGGEKMAWGTCFGFVGSSSYARLDGQKRKGWPYQGYTVEIVTGRHSDALADRAIGSLEASTGVELSAKEGKVRTRGPRWAGLAEESDFTPSGWDPLHAAFALSAGAGGKTSFSIGVPSGKISGALVLIHDYPNAQPPKTVTLDSKILAGGSGIYVSLDSGTKTVFLTLPGELSPGKHAIEIVP
jgi:hypothetical protein